jgi:hypothetical protein
MMPSGQSPKPLMKGGVGRSRNFRPILWPLSQYSGAANIFQDHELIRILNPSSSATQDVERALTSTSKPAIAPSPRGDCQLSRTCHSPLDISGTIKDEDSNQFESIAEGTALG